jgi:hypothetical protein
LTDPTVPQEFAGYCRDRINEPLQAVTELIADLTQAGKDAAWARQATSTSSIIDMVLGDGVASARLELPDGIRRHDLYVPKIPSMALTSRVAFPVVRP